MEITEITLTLFQQRIRESNIFTGKITKVLISRDIFMVFSTVWKFQDFAVNQILREINFAEST